MNANISLDVVKSLALDVWDDLRRTRLAGVAAGLALALLAICVIVLRPSGPPEIQTGHTAASAASPAKDVSFTVPGEEPISIKDIGRAADRDPFRSLVTLAGTSNEGETLVSQAAPSSTSDTVTAATGGSSGDDWGSNFSGGGGGGSSLVPIDDLSDKDREPAAAPKGDLPEEEAEETPPTDYSYAADIQFGKVDKLKRYSNVQRLGLVPSRRAPLLMFLGVSTDHKTAVFMVDSRLSHGGEGRCAPKESLCTFLELQARGDRDEHNFRDADGNEYLLRLRKIFRTSATASGSMSGPGVAQLRGTPPVVDGTR